MGSIWLWIVCAIVVLIGYVIFHFIRKVLERATALKQPDLQTPLKEFKETNGIRQHLSKNSIAVPRNISERFEEMCIRNPLQYKDDPAVAEVIAEYRALLSGKLPDVEGCHMPSVLIDGMRNPDYETYLKAQKKALAGAKATKSGVCSELKRLNRLSKEDNARADVVVKLLEMKLPLPVLNGAVRDEKLNTYTAEDWVKFGKCMREYMSEHPEEIVAEFVETFDAREIIFDSEKMENFSIFRKYHVPMKVVKEIVLDRITVDQAQRIMILVQESEHTWDEATQEILEDDLKTATENDLRSRYRSALNL